MDIQFISKAILSHCRAILPLPAVRGNTCIYELSFEGWILVYQIDKGEQGVLGRKYNKHRFRDA